MKHYFIRVNYYNPSSHEQDWCIISKNNNETFGEETALLFNSAEEAMVWCHSEEAEKWRPCYFDVIESIY